MNTDSRRRGAPRVHPFAWILGVAAVVFGAIALATFFLPAYRVVDARRWTATPCRILNSQVVSHRVRNGRETWSALVTYAYDAGGHAYQGERQSFYTFDDFRESHWRSVVERYPGGARATCYYDPESPGESVLDRGLGMDYLLGYVAAAIFLIVAAGLVRVLRHPPVRRQVR